MEQDFNVKHWSNPCPKYNCRKDSCKCGMKFVSIPAVLGDDSSNSDVAPKNGAYCNTVVRYEANGRVYMYSKEGVPVLLNNASGSYGDDNGIMLVFLSLDGDSGYKWTSDYSYEKLVKNLERVRIVAAEDWLCVGLLQDYTPIYTFNSEEGYFVVETEAHGFRYEAYITQNGNRPQDNHGIASFSGGLIDDNKVTLKMLPTIQLEPYVTDIPEDTTITIPFMDDVSLYDSSTYDCSPVVRWHTGNFIIIPVKRRFGSSSVYDVTEQCLITSSVRTPSGDVSNQYIYKIFESCGVKYKMTFSERTSDGNIYVINKIV